MIVEGKYDFAGPRETVYRLLQDPGVLSKALPGARSLERTGPERYEGVMAVGVGPVTAGDFAVVVELHDLDPPSGFTMHIEGKGAIGFTSGRATVTLTETSDGTEMRYQADLKIGGKIAAVGQRLLDSASKAMTRQGLEAVNAELQARLTNPPASPEASPAPTEPVAAAPPTARMGSLARMLLVAAAVAAVLVGFCGVMT